MIRHGDTPDPLSSEDLKALDSLRGTNPNLWQYVREAGQCILLLTQDVATLKTLLESQKKIAKYARHRADCASGGLVRKPDCDCGFDDVRLPF